MNYSVDHVLYGLTKYIIVMSQDTEYHIPIAIYKTSLKNPPMCIESFKHTIEPSIKCYDSSDIQLIIYFMHCASLPNDLIPKQYDTLNVRNINQLTRRLAVLSWCDDMIKTSRSYANYKSSTIESIKLMVLIVRAIVSDGHGLTNRFDLLKESELPFSIPDYLNEWILLPPGPNGHNKDKNLNEWKKDMIDNITKYKDCKLSVNDKSIRLYDSKDGSCYLYNSSTGTYNITGSDILNKQQQLINDIISRELRIICYEHPEYLKLDRFDNECMEYIYSIMDRNELVLHCKSKPKMTICDIFQYGLAAALTADYE